MAGKQREFPTDPTDAWQEGKVQFGARTKLYTTRPMTEIEALMETAPAAGDPSVSLQTTFLLKEKLADAIEELSPLEKWIAERLFIENMSLRKAGAVLGIPKTSLARRRDVIRRKLETRLAQEPVVTDWFKKRKQSISFGDETLPDQTH